MACKEPALLSTDKPADHENHKGRGERYRPGLLDLGLNASTHRLECSTDTTDKLAKEYDKDKYTVSHCAALNLKGTFLYFQNKYDESINIFKDIIEIDEVNLNARANLEFIYKELGYWTKAGEVKKLEAEDKDRLFQARYFGEQGFAVMFDHIVALHDKERYERGLNLFELCINSECFNPICNSKYLSEAVQWNLWYVQFIHRFLLILKDKPEEEATLEYYIKIGLRCLFKIIDIEQRIEQYKILRSITYMCIGQFVTKILTKFRHESTKCIGKKETIIKSIKDEFLDRTEEIDKWINDPEICFKRAMEVYSTEAETEHPPYEVLVRYARFLTSPQTKEDRKERIMKLKLAEELLKKLDSPKKKDGSEQDITQNGAERDFSTQNETEHDWFSFCTLADIYYELYNEERGKEMTVNAGVLDKGLAEDSPNNAEGSAAKGTISSELQHTQESLNSDGQQQNQEIPPSCSCTSLSTSTSDMSLSSLSVEPLLKADKKSSSLSSTETSYLDKCLEYGKKSAELKYTSELLTTIGKAYQAKAENEKDKDKREKCFFKACSYYLHAQKHCDGKKIPYVHVLHGQCLYQMQQYRPAVESFKTAIACPCRNPNIYRFLMRSYVKLLREMKSQEKAGYNQDIDIEKLKMEICYWLQYIFTEKQKDENLGKGIFDKILKEDERALSSSCTISTKEVVADIVRSMFKQKMVRDMKNAPVEIISYVLTEGYLNEDAPFDLFLMLFAKLLDISTVNEDYLYSIIEKLKERDGQNLNESRFEIPIQNVAETFMRFRTYCCNFEKGCDIRVVPVFRKLHEVNQQLAKAICEKLSETDKNFSDLLLEQTSCIDLETDAELGWNEGGTCSTLALCSYVKKGLQKEYHRHFSQIEEFLIQTGNIIARSEEIPKSRDTKRQPRIRKENFKYDFYVIHSDNVNDVLWVKYQLLPTLETTHKFLGCLDNRDAIPGKQTFDQIREFIEHSFKVIVVITKDFSKDKLCTFKLQSALLENLNKNKVIPLLFEGTKLPSELSTVTPLCTFDVPKLVKALEV